MFAIVCAGELLSTTLGGEHSLELSTAMPVCWVRYLRGCKGRFAQQQTCMLVGRHCLSGMDYRCFALRA